MNNEELGYFLDRLLINYVNEEEVIAVKLNKEILLAFVVLGIITEETFTYAVELTETNEYLNILKLQQLLAEELKLKSH